MQTIIVVLMAEKTLLVKALKEKTKILNILILIFHQVIAVHMKGFVFTCISSTTLYPDPKHTLVANPSCG